MHFAGGNSYSFDFIKPWLNDFEIIALELPGRGRRGKETLLTDFDLAAADIYRQIIEKRRDIPYFVYGHSMGAYLALRVTSMLGDNNSNPGAIFVSGNPGPGLSRKSTKEHRYLLDTKEFKEELRSLGGIPEEVICNSDLFNYLEPILRADFEIIEKNELLAERIVDVPLMAMMGSEEDRVEEIGNWAKFTSRRFHPVIMEGGHFFIYSNVKQISALIRANAVAASPGRF